MCRHTKQATSFFCLLMFVDIKFSLQSHYAVDDSYSEDTGLSQRTKDFTKHSSYGEARRRPSDGGTGGDTEAMFNNNNRSESESAISVAHEKHISAEEFHHEIPQIKKHRFPTKSSHIRKTKFPRSKKSKHHRYIKAKPKTKLKSLRKKHTGKMPAGVRQKHLRSEAFDRRRKGFPLDDRFLDKGVKTERFSERTGEERKHLPLRTNKSTQKGKKKTEPGPEEASVHHSSEHHFSTENSKAKSSSNGTLLAAKEDLIREQLKRMHIELIKLKILRLLRLESPPNITKPLPRVPPHFLQDAELRDEPQTVDTSDSTQPSEAVIFADQELLACPQKSAKCVNFALSQYSGQTVVSAELWVYKENDFMGQRNHTLVVYELDGPDRKDRPQLRLVADALETNVVEGWIKFRLKNTVNFWLDKPHRNHGLQIFCKTCKTGSDRITPITSSRHSRPALIIRFSERHRVPRSARDYCHSKNKVCCKEKLEIDFRKIGWDWIIYPQTIEPSFCRGSCIGANGVPTIGTHHSTLLKWFPESDLQSCCAPTRMRRVSMLTVDNSQNYVKQDMELVVGECGCVF